jgi:hypothetical protein
VLENRAADTAVKGAGSARMQRRKLRLRTVASLDGRTAAGKRAIELIKTFEAAIGGDLSAAQRVAVHRAATLVALSQDAQVRRLAGDMTISLEDVARLDNSANRAVKALDIAAASRRTLTLAEYLASTDLPADSAVASTSDPTDGRADDDGRTTDVLKQPTTPSNGDEP